MRAFWRHRGFDLEAELRARRPEPRPEFVSMLADRIAGSRRPLRSPLRIALAGALTVGLVAVVAGVGGFTQVAAAAKAAAQATVSVMAEEDPAALDADVPAPEAPPEIGGESVDTASADASASDQYRKERRRCLAALDRAHKRFHHQQDRERKSFELMQKRQHRAFHRNPYTDAEHEAFHAMLTAEREAFQAEQKAEHEAFHAELQEAEAECRAIGT